jgi:hypothetical protein
MIRILIGLLAAAAILTGGAVVAVGQGAGSNEAPLPGADPSPPFAGPPTAVEVDSTLQSSFGVLRRARTSGDVLDQEKANAVVRQAPYGLNLGLARRAGQWGSDAVYVLPGDDSVCLLVDRPKSVSTQCARAAFALEGHGVGAALTPDGVAVTGLAPDGVDTVSVALPDGAVRKANVVNNVYNLTIDQGTAVVSYASPGGTTQVPIMMPEMKLGEEVNGVPVPLR